MRKWARWVTKWPLFKPEQSPRGGGAEGKNQLRATSEELEVASGFSRRSVLYSRTLSSEPWAEGRQSVHSLPSHQSISEKGRPGGGPLAQGHRALALWPSNQECLVGTFRLVPALSRKSHSCLPLQTLPTQRVSEQREGAKGSSYAFLEVVAASTPEVTSCPSHSRTPCPTPSIKFLTILSLWRADTSSSPGL